MLAFSPQTSPPTESYADQISLLLFSSVSSDEKRPLLIRKKCWSRFNSKTRNTSYRHGMQHIIMGFGGRVDIVLKLNRTEAYSGIYRVLRGVVPLKGFL